MPSHQPFTALCQAASRPRSAGRADLHLHTTHSDGAYTSAEIIDLACRSGLAAVAITDHDTLDGIAPARLAAAGSEVEVIAGVEISAEYRGRELHLLGYFVQPDNRPLGEALAQLRRHRIDRFLEMVERLRALGVSIDEEAVRARVAVGTVGRRHLAEMLVAARSAASLREAFARYLGDGGRAAVHKQRLDVVEAIALVQGAGGVASWAHPAYDCTRESLAELWRHGLRAVEVAYPGQRRAREQQLRAWAVQLGMAVTAGSDCHGPGDHRRAVGACGVTAAELEALRYLMSR
jgi:predicted metal-dependent phosphoesterase TrpH